jgi:hypothetical protein
MVGKPRKLILQSTAGGRERALARWARRLDALITADRLRVYPVLLIVAGGLGLAAGSLVRVLDPAAQGAFLPDYLAHWTGGRLLWDDPENLYDPGIQNQVQSETLGATPHLAWFVSPPIVAALYGPLALIPYNISALLWLAINTAVLIFCISSLGTVAPNLMRHRRKLVFLVVLAAPPTFELLGSGQDSTFVLLLWLTAIRLASAGYSGWAGAVLGLGFAKPQLVLVVPLVLMAVRNYKALAAFAAVVGAISGISLALVGLDGVIRWTSALSSPLYMTEVQQGQAWKMVGLPSLIQALVPPAWGGALAPVLTLASLPAGTAILLAAVFRLRKSEVDPQALWIATLATTLTFSPHLATYDAILFVPVVAYLLERGSTRARRVATVSAFALMWMVAPLHLAALSLPWPLSALDAPWASLPLAVIWIESLRALRATRHGDLEGAGPLTGRPGHQGP